MIEEKAVILFKEDLRLDCKNVLIEDISFYHFSPSVLSRDKIRTASLIIYCDGNLKSKIIKHRWAKPGMIRSDL